MKAAKYYILMLFTLLLVSCKTGVYTSEGGKSDVAYLTLNSSNLYPGQVVMVTVDDNTKFEAKVAKQKKSREKYRGDLYAISVGQHHVKVEFNGKVLYEQTLLLNTQQTKEITLP